MLTPLKIILELRLKASETRAKQAVAFGLPAKDPGPLFHWRINSLREDYPKQDRVQLSTTTIVNRMVCGKGSADGETGRGRSVVVPFKLTTDRIWQLSLISSAYVRTSTPTSSSPLTLSKRLALGIGAISAPNSLVD
ncbi:uncharacterized protein CIMG_11011 [Coccidioides immitis RS]|uniref:Uncharacterized protein n=1 Tax=Coccidioides immitis (strain RS) TaxID=246410 RepID=A0A0D8JRI8_COCIM|nr:uncharacterized protein CIMG_11011 [Coccidioides immitis RS]KJF59965.1 hypothetical protein CIMG_11011 [Coccidioides immitis RS]